MFKPGDLVECVDDHQATPFIQRGRFYTVTKAEPSVVRLHGENTTGWDVTRFRLVTTDAARPTVTFRRVLQYSTDGKTWLEVPPCP